MPVVLCGAVTVCDRDCRELLFNYNELTGTIPKSIGSLTGLQ
jgi:hypothetical protein